MALFSRLATRAVYNTSAVAQRTGVPADTFRAWERRYGLPSPIRTETNQRLYSDRDVALILWLRHQTETGMTISQAVALYLAQRETPGLAFVSNTSTNGRVAAHHSYDGVLHADYARRLAEALIHYDSHAATRILDEAFSRMSVEDGCLGILQPALHEIGTRWQRGELLISSEHFASAFALRRLGTLFNLSQPEFGRSRIVAACIEGEFHEVGLLMTCVFLSRRGFRVVYLGADLPVEDLIETITRAKPGLTLLSASTAERAIELARASREIQSATSWVQGESWKHRIGFGGRVFEEMPHLKLDVDGVYCGSNAAEAVAFIETMFFSSPVDLGDTA